MPRSHWCSLLALLTALAGCQLPLAAPSQTRKASRAGTIQAPALPGAAAPASAPSAAPVPRYLKKPASNAAVLQGSVAIDAHYVVRQGRGRLIGQASSNLIGQAGSNVVLLDGSPLIGQAGSNLIGQAGSNLIGQAGSNAIKKLAFGLLEAAEQVAIGTVLPAAGIELRAYSLVDGTPLTLGVDEDGTFIYSIFTDPAGRYTVYLPASSTVRNVRLHAKPHQSDDARLDYQLVRPLDAANEAVIDEDTALVSTYVREILIKRFEPFLKDPVLAIDAFLGARGDMGRLGPAVVAAARPSLERLRDAALEAQTSRLKGPERRQLGLQAADAMFAHLDIQTLRMDGGRGELAFAAMLDVLKELRVTAAKRMTEEPDYYMKQPYIQAANRRRAAAGEPLYDIARPSDLAMYFQQELFSNPAYSRVTTLGPVLKEVGVPEAQLLRLDKAMSAIALGVAFGFISQDAAANDVIAAVKRGL